MVPEARLEELASGLAPRSEGWFVVGVPGTAWLRHPAFGRRCVFEAGPPVLRSPQGDPPPDDAVRVTFAQLGITLAVLEPGRPSGLYHAESSQEDFLVLSGECLLLIEEQERRLQAFDFVHCSPGTRHAFVGAGDGPCVLLMVGARGPERSIEYPASELARRHGAEVAEPTTSPREAYAPLGQWVPERQSGWDGLPWG
jgi:uncharacterized cupin superfamily protein